MSESPKFDHLLHCVPDVHRAVADYTSAGLPAHVNPPHLGMRNGAWRLDTRYIEILTVEDRAEFSASPFGIAIADWMPAIDSLIGNGGGALNFAIHVTDAAETADRLREEGHRPELTTFTLEGSPVSFHEVVLKGAPDWAPFFITYSPAPEVLMRQAPDGRVNRGEHDLAGFVVETPDPEASAAWLSRVARVPLDPTGRIAELPGGHVHFAPGSADRITALLLTGGRPPATTLHGLTVSNVTSKVDA
ncbi:VOC family protein [Amycolatopsis minnesotensis]|uniref:Glyoxalase-like domain-containing protein n=1 Tax=Amycolatopsis minnesotensis TaxID=337894 RepID=A0ABP5CBE9_9PSEU